MGWGNYRTFQAFRFGGTPFCLAGANLTDEIPLYTHMGEFMGYYPEDRIRLLISRKEARIARKGNDRRAICSRDVTVKVRALSGAEHGAALKTTYSDMLTTGPVITMKKFRPGVGFIKYREDEGFALRRFNPDNIRKPLFGTVRLALANA